jgi:hypothetical protein
MWQTEASENIASLRELEDLRSLYEKLAKCPQCTAGKFDKCISYQSLLPETLP